MRLTTRSLGLSEAEIIGLHVSFLKLLGKPDTASIIRYSFGRCQCAALLTWMVSVAMLDSAE